MTGLYFILPTLLAILVSFLAVRAGAIALMMTGLDKERAKFQALSAFSGTGFTTKEAELIVNRPKRRRIATWLMVMGNAGIVTVIVTATSSLATSRGYQVPINVLILLAGIFLIYRVATHKGFIKKWETFVEEKLVKSRTFEEETVEDLLHFLEGYGLVRKIMKKASSLIDRSLSDCKLNKKGVLVLGIERDKKWLPIPLANEIVKENDRLVVYGRLDVLKKIFKEE